MASFIQCNALFLATYAFLHAPHLLPPLLAPSISAVYLFQLTDKY